jgi:hypothetical protein
MARKYFSVSQIPLADRWVDLVRRLMSGKTENRKQNSGVLKDEVFPAAIEDPRVQPRANHEFCFLNSVFCFPSP